MYKQEMALISIHRTPGEKSRSFSVKRRALFRMMNRLEKGMLHMIFLGVRRFTAKWVIGRVRNRNKAHIYAVRISLKYK
ncbi:hypothetical protein AS888_00455 [Peribacillus simplex]|uniref:Uncharacterized protein n=1 Tax=Peribacillus simplex TaxID=1478 RepID=A0A109MU81_9BACI|nr:hypothetical protein AS888_00455 [Peribacillus simplex]